MGYDYDFDEEEIPKKCPGCNYFMGYSYDDGIPNCSYDEGYEYCPYFDEGEMRIMNNTNGESDKPNLNINIDMGDMHDRIIIAYRNSIEKAVNAEIASTVRSQFEKEIRDKTTQAIEAKIEECVKFLFSQDVTVGGGWGSTAETLTREQYLVKAVGDKLSDSFEKKVFDKTLDYEITRQIDKFADNTRTNVNRQIGQLFNQAMQQNLTDSIINVLMQNETYQKLNNSVTNLISTK